MAPPLMTPRLSSLLSLHLCTLLCALLSAPLPARAFEWQTAEPAALGLDPAALEDLRAHLFAHRTKAFLLVCDDRIVAEHYAADHGAAKTHFTASLAKAIFGGLSLAVALDDGLLTLDTPASKFIPQWRADPSKASITLRQLGSHTSGISDAEDGDTPHNKLDGWKGEFWARPGSARDPFTVSRDSAPVLFPPGTANQYSNPGIAMMTYAVTAALRDAPLKDVRTLLRERLLRPIGAPDASWSCGYGKTHVVDGLPLVGTWGGGATTARTAARIGRLLLRGGDWDGRRLLSEEAVRLTTAHAGLPGHNGIGWWTNAAGLSPTLPRDAFWGSGAQGQVLLVIPSLRVIAVRNGGTMAPLEHAGIEPHLFAPLMKALRPRAAGAGNPAAGWTLSWAPADTIVRRAKGSDNWPLTWGDDDALYGAYGDGNGFEPFTREKLSLGLARIEGGPEAFRGENLRSPTAEARGDGPKGRKASGLLMVDGTLYLLARNVANAQLAWSSDRGATWTWADWKFSDGFGAPSFVNFGRNYAGARDDFVYAVSHDSDSAYLAAGGICLARVSKFRLRSRDAWEFFAGTDASGAPVWSAEPARRRPILSPEKPWECYRVSMTHVAPLRRYLLVHAVRSETSRDAAGRIDTRFSGGLAIYLAPEPWGPWTPLYRTERWDVGPGDSAVFPSKWIGADGRTLHLVFSGEDSFCVRRATLTPP